MEAEGSLFPVIKKWGIQKGFCAQEPHRVLLGITSSGVLSEVRPPPLLATSKEILNSRAPLHWNVYVIYYVHNR